MALYTTELAAEAMRGKARAETERAKQIAAIQHERERAKFRGEAAAGRPEAAIPSDILASLSRRELYERARQIGLRGRSRMSKDELIEAVRHAW